VRSIREKLDKEETPNARRAGVSTIVAELPPKGYRGGFLQKFRAPT